MCRQRIANRDAVAACAIALVVTMTMIRRADCRLGNALIE
jgi:hypothetical protein